MTTYSADGAREVFDRGMRTRREVLGEEHVNRSLEQVTDFSRPVQELVTEYCWGAVWTRPGLDRRTRSLLNLLRATSMSQPDRPRQVFREITELVDAIAARDVEAATRLCAVHLNNAAASGAAGLAAKTS
jgi:alkylhydroperoxidase/carboxymuconolactone decarboxylase family protein YurZ